MIILTVTVYHCPSSHSHFSCPLSYFLTVHFPSSSFLSFVLCFLLSFSISSYYTFLYSIPLLSVLYPSSPPPLPSSLPFLFPSPSLPSLHTGPGNDILTLREGTDTEQPVLIIQDPHLLDLSDEEANDLFRIEVSLSSPNGLLDDNEYIVLMNDGSFDVSHLQLKSWLHRDSLPCNCNHYPVIVIITL